MDGGEVVRVKMTTKVEERTSGRVILNTRELTEQIHLPTLSFLFSFPTFLRPPTLLISSKSSYSSSSSSSASPLPQLSPKGSRSG